MAGEDEQHEAAPDVLFVGLPPPVDYYPDFLMPFAGRRELHHARFDELREALLLPYGYNTARAYWGDLDDLYWWAAERDKDVLTLTDKDVIQYIALLRRRKYSENTIRRKQGTIRRFREFVDQETAVPDEQDGESD